MRAYLSAFRALDLFDPRRATQRALEADARAKAAVERVKTIAADLDAATDNLPDLAWQWLGDGDAHRALLERVATTHATELAALDELRDLPAHDRTIALPKLAAAARLEIVALLVGSIVRDDALDGVLARSATNDDPDADDDSSDVSPGMGL